MRQTKSGGLSAVLAAAVLTTAAAVSQAGAQEASALPEPQVGMHELDGYLNMSLNAVGRAEYYAASGEEEPGIQNAEGAQATCYSLKPLYNIGVNAGGGPINTHFLGIAQVPAVERDGRLVPDTEPGNYLYAFHGKNMEYYETAEDFMAAYEQVLTTLNYIDTDFPWSTSIGCAADPAALEDAKTALNGTIGVFFRERLHHYVDTVKGTPPAPKL